MSEQANPNLKWYVIQTMSGYENKVATDLATMVENRGMQDRIVDIKIPTETVTEIKDGKTREVERKFMPGYVLIKMIHDEETWFVVRNIHGCTGFVGPGAKPVPLTDEEVVRLGVDKHSVKTGYNVGDQVKIIAGPLKGFSGVVKAINLADKNVSVGINANGHEIPAELELNQIALDD